VAERSSTALSTIQRDIESARQDISDALGDLEVAARSLATPGHWARVARRFYERRTLIALGAAFGAGYWIGATVFARSENRPAVS
jgi:hypothetical protein